MSVDIRATKNAAGDPVLVHVVTGTHDISRHVSVHSGGLARCEDLTYAEAMRKALRRRSDGRAAMRLLAEHGGPDFTITDGELPEAGKVIGEYIGEVEHRYVEALNAVLGSGGASGPDVDRWRGHAEAYRTVAERLHRALGRKGPEYRSAAWRDSNGVYTAQQVAGWRDAEEKDRRGRVERHYVGIIDKHARVWRVDAAGCWTTPTDDGRFYGIDKIEAAHGPCHHIRIESAVTDEESCDD